MARYIGIDIGAETLKVVELKGKPGDLVMGRRVLVEHRKAAGKVLLNLLRTWDWQDLEAGAVTGRLGRTVALAKVPIQQALATGFRFQFDEDPATVVSIGSRGFSVLELRAEGRDLFRENGRCAQGTGNFLQQLVGRFGLDVDEAARLAAEAQDAAPLSGRCPVILKTDMTHLANHGEAKEKVLAGLLDAIAENVQTLVNPRLCPTRLLLAGGVTRSERVREHFRIYAKRHGLTLMDRETEDTLFLEALGAAVLAAENGWSVPALENLMETLPGKTIEKFPSLSVSLAKVRRMPPVIRQPLEGTRDFVFAFDIGSTGSKAVALDIQSKETLWEGYLPTDGAPVEAAQKLMATFLDSPAASHRLRGFAVTGSGREIVGSLLTSCYGSSSVYVINEIAAHARGALQCDPRVDTIFEIGGQDAKYIRLSGGRVVDAAMNEACSAGTGSFIEEQGRRFSGVEDVRQLGALALKAEGGVALGQHCSIFMAEVIDEAVASGIAQDQILAGIHDSVVSNYLCRVKGNRSVGQVIFCQGMPFASDALAAAVARQTGSEVIVPPNPGLMGALGIALLAAEEWHAIGQEALDASRFLQARVERKDQFVCTSTRGCGGAGNMCRIDRIDVAVAGHASRFTWGGHCSLWDKGTQRRKLPDLAPDPFRERREWMADRVKKLSVRRGRPTVAIADEFQLHGLLPFFATFIHALGFDLHVASIPGRAALKRGIEEAPIPFCAPMQQYHGLVAEMTEAKPDMIFLPMIRELPRVDGEPHSTLCPITQGAPDVLRLGLGPECPKIISPVMDMGPGFFESRVFRKACHALAMELGVLEKRAIGVALEKAREAQHDFEKHLKESGKTALRFCEEQNLVPVVVLGRSYTLHNNVLNSNVPSILREQGAIAIPVDCLPADDTVPVFPEVFWGHSQRILRAAWQVRRTPGLYSLFCSNYSCGPDSFTVHTYAWLMEGKPFAILETDGHAGDAGTRTRVEVFLHCVREHQRGSEERSPNDSERLRMPEQGFREVLRSGETLLIPSMGPESQALAAAFRGIGVSAEVLPASNPESLREGWRHTSGKECLPMALTLGSLLARVGQDPEQRFLFLMPAACGPCRFGAYRSLHQMILERLGYSDRVSIWSPPFGDYFQGLPAGFSAVGYAGMVAIGVLEQALMHVRPAELRPGRAEEIHRAHVRELLDLVERKASAELGAAGVLMECITGRLYGIPALLERAAKELSTLDSGRPLPRVLLTGEIYLRSDPFANGNVARALEQRGLRVNLVPVSEFFMYSDHMAKMNGDQGGLGTSMGTWIRQRILHRCHTAAAGPLGLPASPTIPETLAAASPYMRDDLEGEAVLSLGVPLRAWRRGEIDATVLAGPLECMPTKLAEAQLRRAREREGLHSLTISLNGEAADPVLLDNFAFEVHKRFQEKRKSEEPSLLNS